MRDQETSYRLEDSYGSRKRLRFVSVAIQRVRPHDVLDYGCGTGDLLTRPLAAAFPRISFVGVDSDRRSIEHAQAINTAPNLAFALPDSLSGARKFDVVIASEVLEHVQEPRILLSDLVARIEPTGILVLTVPNGYGPYELTDLLKDLFIRMGIRAAARWLRRLGGTTASPGIAHAPRDTLAMSPHRHFFSGRDIQRLIAETGLEVVQQRSRTVFCGFLLDPLIRGRLAEWNAALADLLPPVFSSDWMLVLRPVRPAGAEPPRSSAYAPSRYTYLRRRLKGNV